MPCLLTYLLFTCIGFYPDRVEPVSSRASNMLIEEDTLGFDWGKGSQVLPVKTPCLPEIFHKCIDRLIQGCRCWKRLLDFHQSPFSWVATRIPLGARPICLGGPTMNWSFRRHSSGTTCCHRPATLRRDWTLETACHASQLYSIWNQKNSLEKWKWFFRDTNP